MAARKSNQAPEEETKVQEPAPEEQPKAKEPEAPKASGKMVKVYNPQRYFYVQPSTGIRIKSKEVTEVRDDNWIDLQVKGGILERK